MNGNDERSIVSVNNVASGINSGSSTIKIDSLCIKLGIVKEKGDVQKCRHFSIRGYVAEMREKGHSNLLPFTHEQLPPIEVPQFRYWLCQRCVQNCGTANTSKETALITSVSDQIIVRTCGKVSNPQKNCNGVAVLPFGEGPSGLKSVDGGNDDKSIPAALGADNGQSFQEMAAKATVFQEPIKFSSVDTNVDSEANVGVSGEKEGSGLREFDDLENDSVVKETTTDQPFQSCQHNDYSNGPPRRKARKVRLLKELLSGNTKNSQQKRDNSALRLGQRSSSPSAASPQIKRKILHDQDHDHDQDQDQDQRSVDIATQGYIGKKAKPSKGNNVAKTTVVEHCRDLGSGEGGQETNNKYQWQKHGTQRSSVLDKVGSDPVTAWRTIFSDMGRTDDQVTAGNGASRPTYDISKGRGTEPYSNLMAPPPPPQSDKNLNPSKKISRNPLKSKFYGEDSRKMNVGGSRTKDSQTQSDMELGLGLSLNNDPQAQVRSLPSIMNRNPTQDHGRRNDFLFGSIPHRVPPDLKSKEGYVHDVSNRHAPRPAILQEQWPPYTQLPYGNCSGHQKLDFSDPYKRNTGVRLYSDVMRPHNHERREKMFSVGRSDEREIVELMAKNQYERSLCEARSHRSAGGNNNSWIIPNPSSFPKVSLNDEMPCLHQEYLNMIRPSSSIPNIPMMPTNENMGPTAMRNPATGLFHSDQMTSFAMFDALSQCQKQPPSSGIWISNSGNQRHHDPCYHHGSKNGNKKIPDSHNIYPNPTTNMQVLEAFSPYRSNGTNMSFSQEYAKCSDKDKGKSVMNLDLNVVAPNSVEEQNNSGSLEYRNPYHPPKEQRNELNPKHISSLDSSYSNEAIPAMQLLSLMDAGKSNHHPFMSGKSKFTKPLSPCYNHCSSTVAVKTNPNPIPNSCFPYSSGMRPVLQKPIGSPTHPTHFLSGPETSSLPSGRFRNNKPQEEKSRNVYSHSPSLSHGYRREDAYVFPLPWHHHNHHHHHQANEDRNERVSRAFLAAGPRIDPPGTTTTICTINQNPADFSTPGPENEYMIDYEDLKSRGESSYKKKPALENPNGPKRQKRP